MANVRFTHLARTDLLDIWQYFASDNSETVADRVYKRVDEARSLLGQRPQLGRARTDIAGEARSLAVEHRLVLYRLIPDGVQEVRIVDGARDLTKFKWTPE